MIASVVVDWVVPVILFALVVVAVWIGIRLSSSEDLVALRSAPLFNGLSTRQLRSILAAAHPVTFRPGEKITSEGEPGDRFYLVKEGEADVFIGGANKGTVGPGGYFGEISVIDGGPRTATIVAREGVAALELTSHDLLRTLDRYPSIERLIFLKLRALLIAEGEPVPYGESDPIDHGVLADLGQRVRTIHGIDWSPTGPRKRSWLRGLGGGSRPREQPSRR
jgi:CRP/FNR family transcriptional regulator, cyclic AMP receptor protein